MSEEVKGKVLSNKFYSEPLDIGSFLKKNMGDNFIEYVVDEAIKFYEKEGISPIVGQQKYSGFDVDFFFLVKCFSEIAMLMCKDDSVGNIVRANIMNDFGNSEADDFFRNAKLFVAVLEYSDVIVSGPNKKFIYTPLIFTNSENGYHFLLHAISLRSKKIKEMDKENLETLKKISAKKMYKLEVVGANKLNDYLLKLAGKGEILRNFRA